jgi:signal transduction histidine kinase
MDKLLLIEDEDADFKAFLRLCEKADLLFSFKLIRAKGVEEARDLLKNDEFQFIVSDLGLPGYSPLSTLQFLADYCKKVPCIILTGSDDENFFDRASSLGIYDYLVKGQITANVIKRSIRYSKKCFSSDRKNQELLHKMYENQKMDALGKIAGGVAHEFNNSLAIMSANVEVLESLEPGTDAFNLCVHRIKSAIGDSAEITDKLLAYGRKHEIVRRNVDIEKCINSSVKFVDKSLPDQHKIRTFLPEEKRFVAVDLNQMNQAIFNLILNACEAVDKTKTPEIEVRVDYVKGIASGASDKEFVKISISDNGPGMTEAVKSKALDPFFTTKPELGNAGLGLSAVDGLVRQMNGKLELLDNKPNGLTVNVYLPIQEQANESHNPSSCVLTGGDKKISILYAEDNDDLREQMTRLLEMRGYLVTTAVNGRDAMNRFLDEGDKFDLVLSDVLMPEMNGRELLNEVRKTGSHIPFLFLSGYGMGELSFDEDQQEMNFRYILKPTPGKKLFSVIDEMCGIKKASKEAS